MIKKPLNVSYALRLTKADLRTLKKLSVAAGISASSLLRGLLRQEALRVAKKQRRLESI